jgi:hypothetical protein
VPKAARLRRQKPKGIVVHRGDLDPDEITTHERVPLTSVPRTVADLLNSGERTDLIRQAIADARREGFIDDAESRRLRHRVEDHLTMVRDVHAQVEPV